MDFIKNEFKKYLINEVIAKSNSDVSDIVDQINIFSETPEFEKSFSKWLDIKHRGLRKKDCPRHILG